MAADRKFLPPETPGEAFRGDPNDPAPFLVEGELPRPAIGPQWGHPPTHSRAEDLGLPTSTREHNREQPIFTPAQKQPVQSPEERFGRIAMWLGVVSIFLFGPVLGPVAVMFGAITIQRGEKKLGWLAILFGAIGTVVGIVGAILVAKGVLPTADELLRDFREMSENQ